MSVTLRPCPFCDGEAEIGRRYPYGNDPYAPPYFAGQCKGDCSNAFRSPDEAASAWNRRAVDPADPTAELMRAAEDLGAGWALGDIARTLGATEGPGLTAEEIVDRVSGLRSAAEAVLGQLDYLQGLWGKEAITDGLAGRLRAAVAPASVHATEGPAHA